MARECLFAEAFVPEAGKTFTFVAVILNCVDDAAKVKAEQDTADAAFKVDESRFAKPDESQTVSRSS